MVQPKFNNVSKSKTLDVSPVCQKEKTWKIRSWLSSQDYPLLIIMFILWCHFPMLMFCNDPIPKHAAGLNSSENSEAWSFAVALQFETLIFAWISCELIAESSGIQLGRADELLKFVQFNIPQITLYGLMLLQPPAFDFNLQFRITLFLNTCMYLVVIIGCYIRLLKRENADNAQTRDSDEIPTTTVTVVP